MKTIEELGISPTPWSVDSDQDYGDIEVNGCDGHCIAHVFSWEPKADARLIAASPKLYEALYSILEIVCVDCKSDYKVNGVCIGCSRVVAARKALAEAAVEVSNG